MKIFLTGSTGYVGSKFVDLYGGEFEIFGVARGDSEYPLDLQDFEAVSRILASFRPDIIIHTAAESSRKTNAGQDVENTTPAILGNLIRLALPQMIPIIFTSTEALYGGKDQAGNYAETDPYQPRNPHGALKAECEKLLIASGLPYLITRGHRHVGISKRFHKQKYFPDTLNAIISGEEIHLDSKKLFKPVLINQVCDIFAYHINHNLDKQIILNMGVDKATTFYDFMRDVARVLNVDATRIHDDGNEMYWPADSTISLQKLEALGYPTVNYEAMLRTIAADYTSS